jgi:hypothetical protein
MDLVSVSVSDQSLETYNKMMFCAAAVFIVLDAFMLCIYPDARQHNLCNAQNINRVRRLTWKGVNSASNI